MADILDGVIRFTVDGAEAFAGLADLTRTVDGTEDKIVEAARNSAAALGNMGKSTVDSAKQVESAMTQVRRSIGALEKTTLKKSPTETIVPGAASLNKPIEAIERYATQVARAELELQQLRKTMAAADQQGGEVTKQAAQVATAEIQAAETQLEAVKRSLDEARSLTQSQTAQPAAAVNTGIRQAVKEGQAFEAQMRNATKASRTWGAAVTRDGRQASNAINKTERDIASLINRMRNSAAALKGGEIGVFDLQADKLGIDKTTGEYAKLRAELTKTGNAMGLTNISAGQLRQGMRLLPAQMTDVAVSLASGQPAWLVAIQQGGQLKDSFGGLPNLFKVLTSFITPLRVAMVGLGAAIGAVALFVNSAVKSLAEIDKAIIKSGNYAGVTAGEIRDLGEATAEAFGGGSSRQYRGIINQLVATGQIGKEQLSELAGAAKAWSDATGESVDEVIQNYLKLKDKPVEAILDLNKSLNFLTAVQYDQIRAAEDAGRSYEASALAMKIYADTMADRGPKLVSSMAGLERVTFKVGQSFRVAKGYVDSFFETLFPSDEEKLTESIRKAGAEIERLTNIRLKEGGLDEKLQKRLDAYRKILFTSQLQQIVEADIARIRTNVAKDQRQYIDAANEIDAIEKSNLTTVEKRNRAIKEYLDLVAKLGPGDPRADKDRVDEQLRRIREQFSSKAPADKTLEEDKLLESLRERLRVTENQTELEKVLAEIVAIQKRENREIEGEKQRLLISTAKQLDLEKEIAKTKKVEEDAAGRAAKFEEQTAKLDRDRAQQLDKAKDSANKYFDSLVSGFNQDLLSFGQTDKEAERFDREISIRQDGLRQLDKIEREREADDKKAIDLREKELAGHKTRLAALYLELNQLQGKQNETGVINEAIAIEKENQIKAEEDAAAKVTRITNESLDKNKKAEAEKTKNLMKQLDARLVATDQYYAAIAANERNIGQGIDRSLKEYIERVSNTYETAAQATADVIGTLEGAMTDFFAEGEFNARKFEDTIKGVIARIVAEMIVADIAGLFRGIFTPSSVATVATGSSGAFNGISAGSGSDFGRLDFSSYDTPVASASSAATKSVNYYNTYHIPADVSMGQVEAAVARGNTATKGEIYENRARGGAFSR